MKWDQSTYHTEVLPEPMRQVVEKVFCDHMCSAEVLPEPNSFLSYETLLWGSSDASNTQPDSGLQPHVAHLPAPIAHVFGKTFTSLLVLG